MANRFDIIVQEAVTYGYLGYFSGLTAEMSYQAEKVAALPTKFALFGALTGALTGADRVIRRYYPQHKNTFMNISIVVKIVSLYAIVYYDSTFKAPPY